MRVCLCQAFCQEILSGDNVSIRSVACLVGLFVSAFRGAEFGPLHYSVREREKIIALKRTKGDYDRIMCLSTEAKQDNNWWFDNLSVCQSRVVHSVPSLFLTTDSSKKGWGAIIKPVGVSTGGRWCPNEAKLHINYLEL